MTFEEQTVAMWKDIKKHCRNQSRNIEPCDTCKYIDNRYGCIPAMAFDVDVPCKSVNIPWVRKLVRIWEGK